MSAVLRDLRQPHFTALPPLALYVHLPWCVRKCPYCDFNSHEMARNAQGASAELPFAEYIDALMRDLDALLPSVWGRRITSVFIGGGTPSLFPPAQIDRLLSQARARLTVEPDAEITLEANPGTAEAERFRGYRAAGVNRLSLGIQSFDDGMLRALGRIHDAAEARNAIALAQRHFDNVNLDLMYGLPGQTLAMAEADLKSGIAFGTTHLSAYQLTLEPNTVFHAHPPALPEHDLCADMQDMAEARLAAEGFEHYEVSAFARQGRRCRHNLNYWEFGDYLGIGAGAHGKVSFADRVSRHEQAKQPREYLRGAPAATRTLAPAELPFQFMLNALRLTQGFPETLFEARTGLPISRVAAQLGRAEERQLIVRAAGRIGPTERGRRFLDDLVGIFLEQQP